MIKFEKKYYYKIFIDYAEVSKADQLFIIKDCLQK